MLSFSDYDVIPPCILVGIQQIDRLKELDVFRGDSGQQFQEYIINELLPYINNNYSSSGFNALIGHSNGAEFNQFMLLEDHNPFRGFISISTNFNTDVKSELTEFFGNYDKAPIYYFLANGNRDAYMRTDAGNEFEQLVANTPNHKFNFKKNTYDADHVGLIPRSLIDGLAYIFKDYRNLTLYQNIIEYKDNYLVDLKNNYGIKGSYSIFEIDLFIGDIIDNKKADEYEIANALINDYNLFFGGKIDPVNIGNGYFQMEKYPECIEYFNKALDDLENIDPYFFYANMHRGVSSYEELNRHLDAVNFLIKGRDKLPEKYKFFMNYRIAKLALENQVAIDEGKKALEYCKANFRVNKRFTMDDLVALGRR